MIRLIFFIAVTYQCYVWQNTMIDFKEGMTHLISKEQDLWLGFKLDDYYIMNDTLCALSNHTSGCSFYVPHQDISDMFFRRYIFNFTSNVTKISFATGKGANYHSSVGSSDVKRSDCSLPYTGILPSVLTQFVHLTLTYAGISYRKNYPMQSKSLIFALTNLLLMIYTLGDSIIQDNNLEWYVTNGKFIMYYMIYFPHHLIFMFPVLQYAKSLINILLNFRMLNTAVGYENKYKGVYTFLRFVSNENISYVFVALDVIIFLPILILLHLFDISGVAGYVEVGFVSFYFLLYILMCLMDIIINFSLIKKCSLKSWLIDNNFQHFRTDQIFTIFLYISFYMSLLSNNILYLVAKEVSIILGVVSNGFFSLCMSIYFTFAKRNIKRKEMEKRLSDEETYTSFYKFCQQVYKINFIMCKEDIEKYEKMTDIEQMKAFATNIYLTYLDNKSDLTIRCEGYIKHDIAAQLADPDVTTFKDLHKYVMKKLCNVYTSFDKNYI